MLSPTDKDFFILLRAGLWQKVGENETLSPEPDWKYLYQLSREQTVTGIISDGIGVYTQQHPDINITKEWKNKFKSESIRISRRNYLVNELQAKICQIFDNPSKLTELFPNSRNPEFSKSKSSRTPEFPKSKIPRIPINYVVLKGQTVGRYYPHPNLRISGDMDFFFDYDNFDKARILMDSISTDRFCDHEFQKHVEYKVDDLEVELHADEATTIDRKNIFHKIFKSLLQGKALPHYEYNGVKVNVVPATFNVTYTFLHIIKHYYKTGIGLRQLCDWTMLLNSCKSEINKKELQNNINSLDLTKRWNEFLLFSEQYLGLPEDDADCLKLKESKFSLNNILSKDIAVNQIWEECKHSGNFGKNKQKEVKQRETKFFKRNFHMFINAHVDFFNNVKKDFTIALQSYLKFYRNYTVWGYQKLFHVNGEKFNI